MQCICKKINEISIGKDIIEFKKYLTKLKVNSYQWKILYICEQCNTYWEQRHYGGTYDEAPHLVKVSEEYVNQNWAKE